MLLPAPGLVSAEEDPSPAPDLGLQRIQYIFIFMCFKQWLMLVGYTRSTILPSLDFWLGLHTTLHSFIVQQLFALYSHLFAGQCSVVTITVAEDVKILSGPTLDICGLFTAWWSPKNMQHALGPHDPSSTTICDPRTHHFHISICIPRRKSLESHWKGEKRKKWPPQECKCRPNCVWKSLCCGTTADRKFALEVRRLFGSVFV